MSGINIKIGTISTKFHYPYEGIFGKASPGPEYIIKEIAGNGYINLTKAVANNLMELKTYGGTEQRNLPAGYTQLDGITGDGNAYIDLNMQLTEDDEADIYFTKPSSLASSNVFGGRTGAGQNNISVIISSSGNAVLDFNNSDYTDYRLNTSISLNTQYKAVLNKTGRYIYQGETLIDSNTTACADTIETPGTYLFHLAGSGLASKFAGTINRCVIKGKKDLIPCKDSNNVVGMYDIINGVFYTNTNEVGSFTAGPTTTPTPTAPMDIVSNNGVIKYSPNELNTAEIEVGYYRVQATGVLTESPYNFITGYMPVKPNQSYVFYGRRKNDNRLSSYNRIHWFDADKEFISTNSYNKDRIGTGTAPANAYFAQCSCNESGATSIETTQEIVDGYNRVFEMATAEVLYIPYVEGGLYVDGTTETIEDELSNTATAEMLLKVGDYIDEQEIISGSVIRNVGVLVLDGTEEIYYISSNIIRVVLPGGLPQDSLDGLCTHYKFFKGSSTPAGDKNFAIYKATYGGEARCVMGLRDSSMTSVADFKTFVKTQYNAGTPVIIVYPLATPTTESVTGQTMNIQTGNNTIEITQASIDNLGLYAKYKATE